MIVDYPSLRNFDLNSLESCEQWWGDIATTFDEQVRDYQDNVMGPVLDGSWTGPAAVSAQQAVRDSNDEQVATLQYIGTALMSVSGAVSALSAAQARCDEAVGLASGAGLTVDDNGNIDVHGGPVAWDDPPVLTAMAAQKMIYQARYIAYRTGRSVVPILNYANEFGPNDAGGWQRKASDDVQHAVSSLSDLDDAVVRQITSYDPPVQLDTRPQPYGVESAGPGDYAFWAECTGPGLAYFAWHLWFNAENLFQHFLGNTGTSYRVDPGQIMADMPSFRNTVMNYLAIEGATHGVVDSWWRNYDPGDAIESEDWYYALNDFRYRILGLVMYDDRGHQYVEYTVGVKKPYVFGPPRHDIRTPVGTIKQADLVHLHTTGIAQNFVVQGITHSVY